MKRTLTLIALIISVVPTFASTNVALLRSTSRSFSIRTGEYQVDFSPAEKGDGWVTVSRQGVPDRSIGTKLANGAGLNPTDPGDSTVYRWTDPRKDVQVLKSVSATETPDSVRVRFTSERRWARFDCMLVAYKRYPGLLHWTVDVSAKADKAFYVTPEPDCHFMGSGKQPGVPEPAAHDVVRYMSQRGPASGITYFRDVPMSSNVFYFEDYTSLNGLYRLTGCANPFEYPSEGQAGAVKMGKPYIDFQNSGDGTNTVPPKPFQATVEPCWQFGYERPFGFGIHKGTHLTIADTYLYLKPAAATDNVSVCKDFVNMLADVYGFIKKPATIDTDWAGTVVPRMIKDIEREPNSHMLDGKRFFPRAYVGYEYKDNQLWTLVQLLQPLIEYVRKYPGRKDAADLKRRLEQSLPLFYDEAQKSFLNNLPPVNPKMYFHSVYIFIPTMMVADIALLGNADAKRMMLGYRDRLLEMGRKSGYVFADQWIEDYSKQSGYYQMDETGAYVYIMMALYELSGRKDSEALAGAKAAAEKLTDRCMDLGWQVNLTASGAIGCVQLYKATGDTRYREIAYIPLANTLRQAWLWECDYGFGEKATTFWAFCGTPAAPSSAEFETHRTRLHLKQYQALAGSHLSAQINAMLGDSWRRGPTQSRFALPPYLVQAGAAKYIAAQGRLETDCGEIAHDQMIPLEDFRVGWCTDPEWWNDNAKQGVVGQEIYGAGGPIWYAVWQDEINHRR